MTKEMYRSQFYRIGALESNNMYFHDLKSKFMNTHDLKSGVASL